MDADFWLARWRDGRTFFHRPDVMPQLQQYWPGLALPSGSRVLVPLCGKSLDMIWLAEQGFRVLGVELSQVGVEQFFAENGLQPEIHASALGSHYCAGNIEIICGDIFKLDAATLSGCTGIYDRAALIALPPEMRAQYVRHVYGQLAGRYQGILITLAYAQEQMSGPPFSVPDGEVQALYAGLGEATIVDRRDILAEEPKFAERGLGALEEIVYWVRG
ncbi:MAG: thiopurine S-methyltransferase [Herbaspirillum sp.]|nr:thiopurine S-methyltransferase [Herbaspirillum sp.]